MATQVFTGRILERSAATFLARIHGSAGLPITQASLSSIAVEAWKIGPKPAPPLWIEPPAPTRVLGSTAVTIASSIFDTLQTDSRWTVDATGYNFRHELDGQLLPPTAVDPRLSSAWYRVEFLFTPVTGYPFRLLFDVEALHALGGKV